MENKTRKFQMRLTEEEYINLKLICLMNGQSPSDALRETIKSTHAQLLALITSIPDEQRKNEALQAYWKLREGVINEIHTSDRRREEQ